MEKRQTLKQMVIGKIEKKKVQKNLDTEITLS